MSKVREHLAVHNPDALFFDEKYDGALVGWTVGLGVRATTAPVAVYSAPTLVELIYEEIKGSAEYTDGEEDREAWLDAQEHFYRNFADGYLGDNAPMIIDAYGEEMTTSKFGPNAHPSISEVNTHTDEELQSPEFRRSVERLKLAIRLAALTQGDLDIGTFWVALHEVAVETLGADKGKEQAEMYWSKIQEFADWQLTQPVNGTHSLGEKEK